MVLHVMMGWFGGAVLRKVLLLSCVSCLLMLTGCMFPDERRAENQVPYETQLTSVQQAVDQYQSDHNVLPIRTKDQDTPIYQKYVVDFNELMPRYLQEPPGNSFENGGFYQYVLINPEDEPEVKVIDLRIMREIQELQRAVQSYISEHGFTPVKEPIGPNVYSIDMEKLDYHRDPQVESPYNDTYLPLIMDEHGNIFIDYSIDLNIFLREYDHSYRPGDDIRNILTEHSPIVPAYSVPYTIDENHEPVFKQKMEE
ncbi:hypothetical protein SAMN05192534_101541 [Alteribacillus persepolensis]|uniref:ABC transporter periplasmic binding protein yphF n=1 Tax=Alteribacillus persepolensis TaxID=568899 RepID=A0A1G7ZH00_9BACI|nr:hypothetical protein SAMN05192534_101541 [Alteribacillus persepolensis]